MIWQRNLHSTLAGYGEYKETDSTLAGYGEYKETDSIDFVLSSLKSHSFAGNHV